ncbi:hypothetical protein D9M73_91940 [compost metagenome]
MECIGRNEMFVKCLSAAWMVAPMVFGHLITRYWHRMPVNKAPDTGALPVNYSA